MKSCVLLAYVPDTASIIKIGAAGNRIDETGHQVDRLARTTSTPSRRRCASRRRAAGRSPCSSYGPDRVARRRCARAWRGAPTRPSTSRAARAPSATPWPIARVLAAAVAQGRAVRPRPRRDQGGRRATTAWSAPWWPSCSTSRTSPVSSSSRSARAAWWRTARCEGGMEVVEAPLPCVLTAQKGLNEPRYPSLKGIMASKRAADPGAHRGRARARRGGAGRRRGDLPLACPRAAAGQDGRHDPQGRGRPGRRGRASWPGCCASRPRSSRRRAMAGILTLHRAAGRRRPQGLPGGAVRRRRGWPPRSRWPVTRCWSGTACAAEAPSWAVTAPRRCSWPTRRRFARYSPEGYAPRSSAAVDEVAARGGASWRPRRSGATSRAGWRRASGSAAWPTSPRLALEGGVVRRRAAGLLGQGGRHRRRRRREAGRGDAAAQRVRGRGAAAPAAVETLPAPTTHDPRRAPRGRRQGGRRARRRRGRRHRRPAGAA